MRTEDAPTRCFKTAPTASLKEDCVNAVRFLCVDAIELANSGHPGTPMGIAPAAFVLFDKHMRFDPKDPTWPNRDRFVLSSGHASMLHYALLHLYGYDLSLDDLKRFRQIGSTTPGHPENTITPGVEVTTGPLGQGFCNAVGFAIAEAHAAAIYNRPSYPLISNYTYCIMGDGCVMEGMTAEAASLAGHLRLHKLIVIYDDNAISIEGSTDLTFTEDVSTRFRSYGWNVLYVPDGDTNLDAISSAIEQARSQSPETGRPTLIRVRTTIGFGSPRKAATAAVHGSALGADELAATRENLGWKYKPFEVPVHVQAHFQRRNTAGAALRSEWHRMLRAYGAAFPALAKQFADLNDGFSSDQDMEAEMCADTLQSSQRRPMEATNGSMAVDDVLLRTALRLSSPGSKEMATRNYSHAMLNALADLCPGLIGGSADVSPSTLTRLDRFGDFSASTPDGRNIRYGVREHAMGAITNGLALSGYGLVPYCSTFLVFSDYMRASMRIASVSNAHSIFIMTHDSIGLGEDGATHQPIEQLASLRAMPDHTVWRPADALETAAAYAHAVSRCQGPSTLALSRQKVAATKGTSFAAALQGAYVLNHSPRGQNRPSAIVIATGSELSLAEEAASRAAAKVGATIWVVSMPSWEVFESQPQSYKDSVLPPFVGRSKRLVVEAASSFGWARYAEHYVCIDTYGISAPGKDVLRQFGFTADHVESCLYSILCGE